MKKYDTIVIGGGASGLIAAGRAAREGDKVLLLEKMGSVGRKLLITGKGRCNITNDCSKNDFLKEVHPNGRFLKNAFAKFFSNNIIELLEKYGVDTTIERGRRVFPNSGKAADVVDALYKFANHENTDIIYKCKVKKIITKENNAIGLNFRHKNIDKEAFTKKIILATGGKSYPATGSEGDGHEIAKILGHKITKTLPALVPLETKENYEGKLMGLSLKNVSASVWVNKKKKNQAFGEMIFTHFGISGPIILTLSRMVVQELNNKNNVEIAIDLKPALEHKKLDNRLIRDLNKNGKKKITNIFKNWLPAKLIPVFLQKLEIDPQKQANQISAKERKKIRILIKEFKFEITKSRPIKEAIITAGGICTSQIDNNSMQSKIVKNLFFAGEIIDLDANTGGYNLQIAFSTAWLAATKQ